MKLFNKLFLLLSIALVFGACEKERTFTEYDDLEKGIYPRITSGPVGAYDGAFNYLDVGTSDFTYSVEIYDENKGAGISQYNWTVSYSGRPDLAAAPVMSITNFTANERGLPSATFSFSFQGAMDALGLVYDDIDGGEFFSFNATLVDNQGRSFTAQNTGSNVISSAPFAALFQHRANLICPSDLAGVFDAVSEATGGWGCTATWTGTVEWVKVGNSDYEFLSYGDGVHERDPSSPDMAMGAYYPCYGDAATLPGGTLKFIDACNNLSYSGASRWGEIYTINDLIVDGASLTIDWANDYGEAAITTLTRTDGTNWPDLKF